MNLGGNSGIAGYEIGDNSIIVAFRNNTAYLYTYGSTGRDAIERMKLLAAEGRGLNSFISSVVKKRYASKLR